MLCSGRAGRRRPQRLLWLTRGAAWRLAAGSMAALLILSAAAAFDPAVRAGAARGHGADTSARAAEYGVNVDLGIVLVDVRQNSTVPGRALDSLRNARSTAPSIPIELWIGPTTGLSDEMHDYLRLHSATITLRVFPKRGLITVAPSLDLSGMAGGHVGKAYALLNTVFEYAVIFDGDVLRCPGWAEYLDTQVQAHPDHDIFWTHTGIPFGATHGKNDLYVSNASIDPVVEKYKNFPEHDSGSGVMVRKSNASQAYLRSVLAIYVEQSHVPGMLHYNFTDQAAFREAAFLHRHHLQDVLLDRQLFCGHTYPSSKCQCSEQNSCMTMQSCLTYNHPEMWPPGSKERENYSSVKFLFG